MRYFLPREKSFLQAKRLRHAWIAPWIQVESAAFLPPLRQRNSPLFIDAEQQDTADQEEPQYRDNANPLIATPLGHQPEQQRPHEGGYLAGKGEKAEKFIATMRRGESAQERAARGLIGAREYTDTDTRHPKPDRIGRGGGQ